MPHDLRIRPLGASERRNPVGYLWPLEEIVGIGVPAIPGLVIEATVERLNRHELTEPDNVFWDKLRDEFSTYLLGNPQIQMGQHLRGIVEWYSDPHVFGLVPSFDAWDLSGPSNDAAVLLDRKRFIERYVN